MARFTGAGLFVSFNSVTLTTGYQVFDVDEDVTLYDATAGNVTNRDYQATFRDGTATLDFLAEQGDSRYAACAPGTKATLVWGPEGSSAGKPKRQVTAIASHRREKFKWDDVTVYAINFQFSGPVTESVF